MELEFLRTLGFFADSTGTRLDFGQGPSEAIAAAPRKKPGGILRWLAAKLLPQSSPGTRMRRCLTPGGADSKLEEAVRGELSFLFRQHSATVTSNHRYPAACGNAIIVLAANGLFIRVIRDRDEILVDLAPAHAPTKWKLLSVAVAAVQTTDKNPALVSWASLERAGRLLEDNWESLDAAFAPERYASTQSTILEIEAAKLAEWVAKFNPPALRAHSGVRE
jgi:hypothetical protein